MITITKKSGNIKELQHLHTNFTNFMNQDLNKRFVTVGTYVPYLRVRIFKWNRFGPLAYQTSLLFRSTLYHFKNMGLSLDVTQVWLYTFVELIKKV